MTDATDAPRIDLNADLGEGAGDDEAILDVVTSASIACGGHAGDAVSMRLALTRARERGVAVGAHPSYVDREQFGRRSLDVEARVLQAQLTDQVRALADAAADVGTTVRYVKPHGALYNTAMVDPAVADVVLAVAATALAAPLPVFALPGSVLARRATAAGVGVAVVPEAFADRAARADGTLVPRGEPGAVLTEPEEVRARVAGLAAHARTVCVHGDTPGALTLARAARTGLEAAGFRLEPVLDAS